MTVQTAQIIAHYAVPAMIAIAAVLALFALSYRGKRCFECRGRGTLGLTAVDNPLHIRCACYNCQPRNYHLFMENLNAN